MKWKALHIATGAATVWVWSLMVIVPGMDWPLPAVLTAASVLLACFDYCIHWNGGE